MYLFSLVFQAINPLYGLSFFETLYIYIYMNEKNRF